MKKPRFKYPSVTEVLEPYVDFSMVKPEILEAAKIRGNVVHAVSASYAKIGFVVVPPPQRYQGYFDSFRRWFDKYVDEVIDVEKRIYHDALRVCGQMDLFVTFRKIEHKGLIDNSGLPSIVDIKTPAIYYKTWTAQVSAYKFLAEQEYKRLTGNPCSLQVKEDGSEARLTVIESVTAKKALEYWLKALDCYHYFTAKGETR